MHPDPSPPVGHGTLGPVLFEHPPQGHVIGHLQLQPLEPRDLLPLPSYVLESLTLPAHWGIIIS
jgi:hypothetical protein